ncbi:MAG: SHOCT domain-containing protein [Methanobacterium sp.]|nr:SHOCT domain-containing protein [Methanobacterium sp.]
MVEDKECPKCSTTNSPENKFCKECGTPLPDESEVTAETQNQNLEEIQGSKSSTSKESKIKISTNKKATTKKEDPVESLMDTGKDIMEGIGGFINKATESHETGPSSPGDGLSINGMITEERVGFSGQHSTDMQQATVTLTEDKLVIKKKSFLGESDRGEKHIRYEDITTVDLDKKVLLTPGAIQIYTNSGQFTIRKNKAHKLEPFFKNLSKKVDQAKKINKSPLISEKSAADELRKFAELRDDGIITEEEFQAKKKEIMNE